MGPPQVSFSFRVESSSSLCIVCWCLLWYLPSGSNVETVFICGGSTIGVCTTAALGAYLWAGIWIWIYYHLYSAKCTNCNNRKDDVFCAVYIYIFYYNLLVAWLVQLSIVLCSGISMLCSVVFSLKACVECDEVTDCVNVWCIYTVKPTWRHGTASALTSLISILLQGEGCLHRAESVLQNCVMGRCANLHIIYCYISLFTMKKIGTQFD